MEFTGERYLPNIENPEISYEHWHRYLYAGEFVKNKKVLDIACGEGYGSYLLAQKNASQVIGIDIDQESITEAKEKYLPDNLQFQVGSTEDISQTLAPVFDVVVSFETIEHISAEEQNKFLTSIKQILKPGGLLIASTPNKLVYSDLPKFKNEFHENEFYLEEFKEFLGQSFKYTQVVGQRLYPISYIWNTEESNKEWTEYKLRFTAEGFRPSTEDKEIMYAIALCSDKKITSVNTSILVDLSERMFEETRIKQGQVDNLSQQLSQRNGQIEGLTLQSKHQKNQIDKSMEQLQTAHDQSQTLIGQMEKRDTQLTHLIEQLQKAQDHNQYLLEEKEKQDAYLREQLQTAQDQNQTLIKQVEQKAQQIIFYEKEVQKNHKQLEDYANLCKEQEQEILSSQSSLKSKENLVTQLDSQVKHDNVDIEKMTKAIEEKDTRIISLKARLENKIRHVDQLEVDLKDTRERLEQILHCHGWRALLFYYSIRDKNLPLGSRRRKILQQLFSRVNNLASQVTRSPKGGEPEVATDNAEPNYLLEFPYFSRPKVSIIIPVYNQWNYTYFCLVSILKNTLNISYEVIVANDNSTDQTQEMLKSFKNVQLISNKTNLGFLKNCNQAASQAHGEYLHFLNNDTEVNEGWLDSLLDITENDETVGMVGSKLVYSNGTLQESGGVIWQDASGWNFGRTDDPEKPEYNYVKEVDYISGASIMIRKSLWEEIGGFDQRYAPAYCEDSDLAFEVRARGYKVVFQPKSVVTHHEGITSGTDINSGIKKYQQINNQKFFEKWQKQLEKGQFESGQNVFWARDRSQNKKTLLFIDHYVPHFDQDAGSQTTYQYIKFFIDQGFNIKFIGDNFFRHEPYTTALQQLGIEVLYGDWYASNWQKWISDHSKYLDYVFLNRPHISIKYIDFIKQNTRAKIIYYGHDLHYLREKREYELYKNEQNLNQYEIWKEIEFRIFSQADVIYYPSQIEVDLIKQDLPKANVKAIPAYIFDNTGSNDNPIDFSQRKDIMFVGGFKHKPNGNGILWFVKEVFPAIVKELPKINIYIIGSHPTEEVQALASENVIVTGYVDNDTLDQYYAQCKIAVVPLLYGAGVKGKVVEALHNRIPLITTSIGAEGLENIEDYLKIADKKEDFAGAIVDLYNNQEKLQNFSSMASKYIAKYFSPRNVADKLSADMDLR